MPTLSLEIRRLLAKIAVGSAVQSATFYTFLHLNTNAAVASHSVESESNLPADFTELHGI